MQTLEPEYWKTPAQVEIITARNLPSNDLAKSEVPNPFDETGTDLASPIKILLQQTESKLQDPELQFKINAEAAATNLELLKRHKFDLTKLHNKGQRTKEKSATSFGSKIKDISVLEQIFKKYPKWTRSKKQLLIEGIDFYLHDLDEETRKKISNWCFISATTNQKKQKNEFLTNAIKKEIRKVWNLILQGDC